MKNALLDFAQGASNAAADTVAAPVDGIAWLLRKAGLPVPQAPVGGSDWMAQRGLTAKPRNALAGALGESAGLISPMVAAARAPQIANALLKAGENAARPSQLGKMGQRGAVLLGDEWAGKSAPKIEKLAKNKDKFLYHSGVADDAANMKYGIEPTNDGPWIREVAGGATDDVDSLLASSTPLAWMSDAPTWVQIKVARKLNKPPNAVTTADIEKHGHLAVINKKSSSLDDTYYIPGDGLANGPYSTVVDMRGRQKKAYETGLYGEDNYGRRIEPFGVERNEYVSTKAVDPLLQLTGPELVQFLRAAGVIK